MPQASYVQTNFLGGEISQAAQGRFDDPKYKISLSVCLNGILLEAGAWVRRPGTRHIAISRLGAQGRAIPFAFKTANPYVMQITVGAIRFTTGNALVMTNDQQIVTAISTANPAEITTGAPHGWPTGSTVMFNSLGVNNPLLQNRQFTWTSTGATTGTIAGPISGQGIDGSTLGTFVSGNITRVLEITHTFTLPQINTIRSVQAENRTLLVGGPIKPRVLQVASEPSPTAFATFSAAVADFIDGPYFDPIDGSWCQPGALNGTITLTFFYQDWDATRAYNVGDLVTYIGANYRNNSPLNQGTPPLGSGAWDAVIGAAPVNNGSGFQQTDIGRLVRLYSEPPLWVSGQGYTAGQIVAYADGAGGYSYWTALKTTTAQPGTDATAWALNATGARWTWGQIVALGGTGIIAPQTAIGSMSGSGGLAAAFDGTTAKTFGACSTYSQAFETHVAWSAQLYANSSVVYYVGYFWQLSFHQYNAWVGNEAIGTIVTYGGQYWQRIRSQSNTAPPPGGAGSGPDWQVVGTPSDANNTNPPAGNPIWTPTGQAPNPTLDVHIGQHYSSGKTIAFATIYPASDIGFVDGFGLTINLRANTTAPAYPSDGALLGTSGPIANTTNPVTIVSGDQTTSFTYVWFEVISPFPPPLPDDGSHSFTAALACAQAQFYSNNASVGSVISVQLRGPALLYNQTIRTWRIGVYSETTGYPACGTYADGRIWLGGAVGNRFDACRSNGFKLGSTQLDFTPTAPNGTVAADHAISYTVAGEDVNPIEWMKPDLQGVLFGTKSGEWLISAPTSGAIAPTNIKVAKATWNGVAAIEPRRTEHTLVFVHKFRRQLVEYFADVFSGKFTAPDLNERSRHLTVSPIAEIAYQQEKTSILWCRRDDGSLIGATYKRDTLMTSQGPTIIGWHRHTLGSGRTIESLAVGPSVDGTLDTLILNTNDAASGTRHIEAMTDILDEGFALTDCWFLDDAIVPSSTVVQAAPTGGVYGSLLVNGLWSHNGKTVTAFIAGLDCGEYTVSNGSITVPFGDGVPVGGGGTANGLFTAALVQSYGVLPALVGFTYTSDGQLVRPVEQKDTGARSGPGWAKLGREHRAAFQLYGVVNGSFKIGTDFDHLDPLIIETPGGTAYTVQQLFSGVIRQEVDSLHDFNTQLCWRITRPLPAFVTAAGAMLNKEDV